MGEKLTPARRRVLAMIVNGSKAGVRPEGADLRTAYGLRAWGWCEARHIAGHLQERYFPTDAGRAALPTGGDDGAR